MQANRSFSLVRWRWSSTWLLFTLVTVVYFLLAVVFNAPKEMSLTNGDEPHYLLEAHSLLHDGDWATTNNYANQDYRPFYGQYELDRHLFVYKGRTIPHHYMPGMPLLILPGYALAGRVGVRFLLSLLMAVAMIFLLRATRPYVAERIALVVVGFCALTYPLLIYSHQIYPETVAFILVSFSLAQIVTFDPHTVRRRSLLTATALGLLPFFHFKLALLSVTLYVFLLWKGRAQLSTLLTWSLGPIALAMGLFGWWIYHVFGEFSLAVFLRPSEGTFLSQQSYGILGLFFDQEYGLFFFAPIFVLAPVGLWSLWRDQRTRRDALFLLLIYGAQHILSGSFHDWDGGLSGAPRYLVSVLPLLVLFTARAVDALWRRGSWGQTAIFGALTLWISGTIVYRRPLMFGFEAGSNTMLREFYHANWLTDWLPSFKRPIGPRTFVLLALLMFGILLLWLLGEGLNRLGGTGVRQRLRRWCREGSRQYAQ